MDRTPSAVAKDGRVACQNDWTESALAAACNISNDTSCDSGNGSLPWKKRRLEANETGHASALAKWLQNLSNDKPTASK